MISIIITTKDRVNFLKRAVDSILSNSLVPDEIIIINDGGVFIEYNEFNDDRITIINNDISKGGNAARNQGLYHSKGEVIFFLDDDDALLPYSIESRMKVFNRDDKIGLVYTGKSFVYDTDLNYVYKQTPASSFNDDCTEALLLSGNFIGSTSCVAVKRDIAIQAKLFDEKLYALQDYDFWIRISMISKISHDNQIGLLYTVHKSGSQISSNYNKYLKAGEYLAEKYSCLLSKYNCDRKFKSQRYLRVAISAAKNKPLIRLKYAFKSLVLSPNWKGLFLLFPISITRFIKKL